MKTTTIIRRLTSTDVAGNGAHGSEPPVEKAKLKAVENFFGGKKIKQQFTDVNSGRMYELRLTDYKGTSTPNRVAPIGAYRKHYDLQIGDQLIIEKIERPGKAQEYLIGYLKSAAKVSIYGEGANKGIVEVSKLEALIKIKILNGTATQPKPGEYHVNGKKDNVNGTYVFRCIGNQIEVEFNGLTFPLKGKVQYEIDFSKKEVVIREFPDWEIKNNKPILLSQAGAEDYSEDDAKTFSEIKETDLLGEKPLYTPNAVKKENLKMQHGKKIYPRKRSVYTNALKRAEHNCEYSMSHKSFLRKNSTIKYMEPHHLIPLQFHEDFDWSLDVEANVVSLCSECHNQIHYGNGKAIIRKLWKLRKNELKAAKIPISEEDLLKYYGY